MKSNEKKMILIIIIIGIIIISLLVKSRKTGETVENNNQSSIETTSENATVEVLESGRKLNVSEKLAEAKMFGDYEMTNIQLSESNGQTELRADLKNVGNSKLELVSADIEFKDKEGNIIGTINDVLIGEVEAGKTTKIKAETSLNCVEAYDISISIKE